MKDYELSILFHPDLEMNLDPAVSKVKKTIETSGGKISGTLGITDEVIRFLLVKADPRRAKYLAA